MANENKKKTKYPEGYIGRPKAMKTKKIEFHKPTAKFYVELGIFLAIAAFLTYIVIRLVNVEKQTETGLEFYSYEEEKMPESFVLENNKIRFELNPRTTQFTVLQKSTGHLWNSNPVDSDNDPIALAKEKNNMKAPFILKYSTINGSDDFYDFYSNSVKRNFYSVEKKGNEVIVNYTVGQMEREYTFPLMMYQDELEKYQEKLSTSQSRTMLRLYKKFEYANMRNESEKQEYLEKYPELESKNLYLLFDTVKPFQKEQLEEMFTGIGYTYEDYLKNKELYKETNVKDEPGFNVTVKYSIDGNSLCVSVPFDEIGYKSKYPITQLSILPYFAAAGKDDEGFIFVPEGSGSLMQFNNGKTKQNTYYADVYGWDYGTDRKAKITETRISFPVFGMSYGDSSFISIPVSGAEYAGFTAEIAGKLGSYNYVRADYKMLHREQFDVSARNINSQFSYEKSLPKGEEIKQIFTFVDGGSYVDMAKAYRNYLFGNEKTANVTETPIAVEIVGAVDKMQQVLGLPKNRPYKLTTYSQTADIVKQIDDMGIKNANVKLSGGINGGIRQKLLKKFKFVKELGGKAGFTKMVKDINDTSAKFYLDASVQTAHRSGLTDGFNKYRDAARFVSDDLCQLYDYSPIWYGKLKSTTPYYLLRSSVISRASDVLLKNAQKYGVNISYKDNGYILSGDYNQDRELTRAQAKANQLEKLQNVKDAGLSLMINSGNDYAVKSADFITNMSFHGNKYAILDETVPFYQIALHGYKNYAGVPLNLSYEQEQVILESAECGAGLFFVFMGETEKSIQETDFTEYYSACFDNWKEKLPKIYKEYDNNMGKVKNSLISNHEYLTDSVTVTSYENGYKVYVNFGYIDYKDENVSVPARQYKVVK